VAAAAATAVVGLVDGVGEHGDLSAVDPAVTADAVRVRTPVLTILAEVVTMVGSEVAVGLLTTLVVAWLVVRRRDRLRALHFGVTMAASAAVTLGVKHLVARGRPPAAVVLGPVDTGYSFPSGHTLFSTVFFGLVALLLADRLAGRRGGRSLAAVGWVVASLAVGASRIYLGYHWFTDVAAGWVLGVLVLAIAFVALALLQRSRAGASTASRAGTGLPRLGRARGADPEPVSGGVEGVDDARPAR
jgi:undecaprenyl-diphosphatase